MTQCGLSPRDWLRLAQMRMEDAQEATKLVAVDVEGAMQMGPDETLLEPRATAWGRHREEAARLLEEAAEMIRRIGGEEKATRLPGDTSVGSRPMPAPRTGGIIPYAQDLAIELRLLLGPAFPKAYSRSEAYVPDELNTHLAAHVAATHPLSCDAPVSTSLREKIHTEACAEVGRLLDSEELTYTTRPNPAWLLVMRQKKDVKLPGDTSVGSGASEDPLLGNEDGDLTAWIRVGPGPWFAIAVEVHSASQAHVPVELQKHLQAHVTQYVKDWVAIVGPTNEAARTGEMCEEADREIGRLLESEQLTFVNGPSPSWVLIITKKDKSGQ